MNLDDEDKNKLVNEHNMPEHLITRLEPSHGRKLAYIPIPFDQGNLDREMTMYKKIKFTRPPLSLNQCNNFNELLFFMNSVFRVPIFNDGQTLNKYLALLYGVTPNQMADIIQTGQF